MEVDSPPELRRASHAIHNSSSLGRQRNGAWRMKVCSKQSRVREKGREDVVREPVRETNRKIDTKALLQDNI